MGATGELHLQIDGQSYVFRPGELVRIGRAPDNDVVVAEPTVSRQHAQMVWADGGWIYESVGNAATLLQGQPVTRLAVTQPVDLTLGSAQGPVLRIDVQPGGRLVGRRRARRGFPRARGAVLPGGSRPTRGITATATPTPTLP